MANAVNLADALAEFTFSLYQEAGRAAGGSDKSVIASPFSISVALSMIHAGAGGNTKEQLKRLLMGDSDQQAAADGSYSFAELIKLLNRPDAPYRLNIANRLFAHKTNVKEILPTFVEILEKSYESQLESKDFSKRAEESRREINAWVSKTTDGKIKELLPQGSVDDARLILVNAVYFKGSWDHQFDSQQTVYRPFIAGENREKMTKMMHASNRRYRYAENGACQVLGIPYRGKELCMYLLLPKDKLGLQALEECLRGQAVLELIKSSEWTQLKQVALPKFKLEQSLRLVEALKRMGADDMFKEGEADFSSINGKTDLFVSNVVHKACIEINEEGTEAAASTAATITKRSVPMEAPPSIVFIADHPFLFAIFDHQTMTFLFIGRYCG